MLDRADVDTDQIIPKQFLKRIERTGFGEFLFYDWRQDPDFELNRPEYAGARILLAGPNFGCGSSREHAAWALQDYGFEVVIAPSFGDIFFSNSVQIGLVPVIAPAARGQGADGRAARTGDELTVDLEAADDRAPPAGRVPFEMDPFVRHALLDGLDAIARTLQHEADIAAFEARTAARRRRRRSEADAAAASPSPATSRFVRSRSSQKSSRSPSSESGPRFARDEVVEQLALASGSRNGSPTSCLWRLSARDELDPPVHRVEDRAVELRDLVAKSRVGTGVVSHAWTSAG